MNEAIKRQLRSVQTHFPFIRPLKFHAYNAMTRHLGLRISSDFQALRHLGPIDLALDIGGNWGQSIYALKRCCNPAQIVSFEPNAELAARLQREFSADAGVTIETCGLADTDGSFELFVPRYRNFVYDGLASNDREEALTWLNPVRMARFDAAKLRIDSQQVQLRRLDDLHLAPQVVKIDVQGVEDAVVRGGRAMFTTHRPASIVEAPSPDLCAFFALIGMQAWFFNGRDLVAHDGKWKNVLFLTQEQVDRIAAGTRGG
jgi:FkbM family methyltransferase